MRRESALSLEKGAVRKDWGGRFPIALGYPNSYSLAMSNLGFQTIYHLLNRDPRVVAERFYLPERLETGLQAGASGSLLTHESQRPVAETRALLFSISFCLFFTYFLFVAKGINLTNLLFLFIPIIWILIITIGTIIKKRNLTVTGR